MIDLRTADFRRRGRLRVLAIAAVAWSLLALAGAHAARAQGPHWKLSSRSAPTNLPLMGEQLVGENDQSIKGEGMIIATANNLGYANANGTTMPITITDQLPAGLEAIKVRAVTGQGVPGAHGLPVELSCPQPFTENRVVCTFEKEAPPFEHLEMRISVRITTTTPSEPLNTVTVTGGETNEGKLEQPVKIVGSGGATPFGVEAYELTPENEDGTVDTQAGSHPFQLTTTFDLNQTYGFYEEFNGALPQAPALQKDLSFRLPPGLIGNPNAVPQCSGVDFGALDQGGINSCPDSTAIGVASVTFNNPIMLGLLTWSVPVFNLVPAPGEPARFGFEILHVPIVLDTSVRTGEDYGVTVSVRKTPEAVQVLGAAVTLWGVPGDSRHDRSRGWNCLGNGHWVEAQRPVPECTLGEFPFPAPFVDLPTNCPSQMTTTATGDAWSGQQLSAQNSAPVALGGCGEMPFEPSLEVISDEHSASTPSGGTVEVTVPQKTTLEAGGIAEADIRDTTLELPVGVQASAGAANGLETCGVGVAGFIGAAQHSPAELEAQTGNALEDELATQGFTAAQATCPGASKIGTVEVETPLLPNPLKGSVYLASQNTDPFASPLALYLVATEENPVTHEGSKVLVKLAGEIVIDPATGQLVSTFRNTPPVAFEHLKVHLFDGPGASQATPAFCGSYQTKAVFTSWAEATKKAVESKPEAVTSGPGEGPCPGSTLPFSPSLHAGVANPQAAAFSPFELTLNRPDGDQALTSLTAHLPLGAAAVIASVTPCQEPPVGQEWSCGPESLIGHSTASSGLGGDPYTLGGEVYLTRGYDGAPFGILDATLAKAGPFNLGWVYVRSRINVNPETAAVTVTTDEGPHKDALPTMLKGVPVQLKTVDVTVDREHFEFNPTSCKPDSVGVTLTGNEGGSASPSAPFNTSNCANLPFAPKLTATVDAQGSKANGIGFRVDVTSAGLGVENLRKVFLTIPTILPARLQPTLQHACLEATFNANPAACPEESVIGTGTVHTPVFKSPLTGPAYIVSHGNAAFPDVEFVLQGEGVTVVLDGKTDIKKGVTYSRFESSPDAPFTTFETVLPAGPHSIFTANTEIVPSYNVCGQTIALPTEIIGQDGAVITQNTTVAINGCKGVSGFKKKATRAQLLAKALKACKKIKKKQKRQACEKAARKKYGAKHSKKHPHKKSKKK